VSAISNPVPALVLVVATIGAAWSLPRWRSLLGLSGELVALTALLALRGHAIFPEACFPGRTVELVVLGYTFVRIQKLFLIAPDPVEALPASAVSRWGFEQALAAKNAHLLAFSAYVIGFSALEDPFVKWSSLAMPLLMGLLALNGRWAVVFMTSIPFLAGITYLAISGG
jgi:hypothetical protein